MKKSSKFRVTLTLIRTVTIAGFVTLVTPSVFAMDLMEVYQQALKSDPTFKTAHATFLSKRENLPITRASLLPQLSAIAGMNRVYTQINSPDTTYSGGPLTTDVNRHSDISSYSLNLTQPVFNFSNWAALRGAKAAVKQAEAEFTSATQDLMYRVAAAYFAVLQSQDILRYTSEQKKAVDEQLRQQQQRYTVGLVPITDVNEAQASYDTVVAQEIAAQNDLQTQQEKLQEITGIKYTESKTLKPDLPLVIPEPEDMEKWVRTSEQQSYALLAVRYATAVAREAIATQEGGHFPVLNAVGSYGYTHDSNYNGSRDVGRQRNTTVGLNLSVPIFSGGVVSARSQQARYLYQQAVAMQDKTHRSVVSETRQAYLGVVSGVSKIKADRQVIKSKVSALQSTQNAYDAGMRTMVEMLQAEAALYDAERNYAKDQYAYILNTLLLKQKAGTLNAADLEKVNQWLEQPKPVESMVVVKTDKKIIKRTPRKKKNSNKVQRKAIAA